MENKKLTGKFIVKCAQKEKKDKTGFYKYWILQFDNGYSKVGLSFDRDIIVRLADLRYSELDVMQVGDSFEIAINE